MADRVLGGGSSRGIVVIIESAKDLRAADLNGKSDPYVVYDWAERPRTKRTSKTHVIEKNLNPTWHHTGHLSYSNPKDTNVIEFDVWDKDIIGKHDFLGYASIDIGKALEASKEPSQKFVLTLRPRPETKKKTAEKIKGTLVVTLKFPETLLIDEKELAQLGKVSKFGNDLLASIIVNYKKVAGSQGVSGKQQIMSLARDAHVIDLLIELSGNTEAKNIDSRLKDKVFSDPAMEELFYTQILNMFDVNRDGNITLEEFVQGLSTLTHGTRDEKAALHFAVADDNGDGELTLDEVIKLQKGVFSAAKIGFKVGFNEGGKELIKPLGPLTQAEFNELLNMLLAIFDLSEIAEFAAQQIFASQDKDKNGKISKEEYIAWYCNDAERARIQQLITEKAKPIIEKKALSVGAQVQNFLVKHL
jgi:Ca2+-binding EF-hand superfamily protein